MGFTVTDPRAKAYNEAAGNFGSGLGEALNQYVNNKLYRNAIGGLGENASVQDTLNAFAQHNVPLEQQQQHFSPVIEAGRQRERTKQSLDELVKRDWSNSKDSDIVLGVTNALRENPQLIQSVLPSILENARRNRYLGANGGGGQGGGQQSTGPLNSKPMQPSTEGRGQSSEGYSPAYASGEQGMVQPNQGQGEQPQQQGIDNLFTSPQGSPQQAYPNEGFQDVDRVQERADDLIRNYGWNVDDAYAQAEKENTQRDNQIKQEEAQTASVKAKLAEKYGVDDNNQIDAPKAIQNLAIGLNRYQKGTDEQKFNKTERELDKVTNSFKAITAAEMPSWWEFWSKGTTDEFYDDLAGSVKVALKASDVPEDLRPNMLELSREVLSMRPDLKPLAIAEVMQRVANPSYKKDVAGIDRLPDHPDLRNVTKQNLRMNVNPEKVQKELNEIRPQLVNQLYKTLTTNPYSSPLLLKEALIEKGYDDRFVNALFDEAFKTGWHPSAYQASEYSELRTPLKATPKRIHAGQKTLRSFQDRIMGVR